MTHTAQHAKAAKLLANGKTVAEIAEALEVSRASVYNWMKLPEFVAAVKAHGGSVKSRDYGLALDARLDVRVTVDFKETIEACAAADGSSPADWVREVLEGVVGRRKKREERV